jgi:hypothetical protein
VVAAAGPVEPVTARPVLAADTFVTVPGRAAGPDVVAEYLWFGAWSRDTMTSYDGLSWPPGDRRKATPCCGPTPRPCRRGCSPTPQTPAQPSTTPPPRRPPTDDLDARIEWIGPDDRGLELEIIAVEPADLWLVIHVMPTALRRKP